MNKVTTLNSGDVKKVEHLAGVLRIVTAQTPEARKRATREQFDVYEQLAALMEQVEALSKKAGVEFVPRFAEQLATRVNVLKQHQVAKEKYRQLTES